MRRKIVRSQFSLRVKLQNVFTNITSKCRYYFFFVNMILRRHYGKLSSRITENTEEKYIIMFRFSMREGWQFPEALHDRIEKYNTYYCFFFHHLPVSYRLSVSAIFCILTVRSCLGNTEVGYWRFVWCGGWAPTAALRVMGSIPARTCF